MLRKIFFLSAVGVAVLFLLNVFATPTTESTWTVRLRAPHGLQAGDVVKEGERRIGRVVAVNEYTERGKLPRTDVLVAIDSSFRERMREQATVMVTTPPGAGRPVLRLIVFDEHSSPLPPGSIIAGAESSMEVELKRQLLAATGAVRDLSRQLDDWSQTLDKTSRSEELKKLEGSAGGLIDTLRQAREDLARAIDHEITRLKKLYDKLFPKERETT
jgi:ABC-type transporter Mla subunit MlaD